MQIEVGNYTVEESTFETHELFELLHCTWIDENDNCIILYVQISVSTNLYVNTDIWTLFFEGSKSQEGAIASYILINPPLKKHHLISCRPLEFECTNNTRKYEALNQGLKKSINLNP